MARNPITNLITIKVCGRTVNGVVGLLWMKNRHVYQAVVEAMLRREALQLMPELLVGWASSSADEASEADVTCVDIWRLRDPNFVRGYAAASRFSTSRPKQKRSGGEEADRKIACSRANLDLWLTSVGFSTKKGELQRLGSPSVMTMMTCVESAMVENLYRHGSGGERKP